MKRNGSASSSAPVETPQQRAATNLSLSVADPPLVSSPREPTAPEILALSLAWVRRARRLGRFAPAVIVAVVTFGVILDFAADLFTHQDVAHIALEALGIGLWVAALTMIVKLLRASWHRANELAEALERARLAAESAPLPSSQSPVSPEVEDLVGLIDRQFREWSLSTSEREVALLLLKGLSLKDIAAARDSSEPTVRQQAQAVYRKANLAGRAELSAFFLEDLLTPAPTPPKPPASSPSPTDSSSF